MDPRSRISVRNAITPSCVFIEDHLLPTFLAQQFRRLQHRLFGLTASECNALGAYFTTYEELGVAVQWEKWLRGESVRLKCILADNMSRGLPTPEESIHAYADILHERKEHKEICRLALQKWRKTADGIKDTPIYRGICATRARPYWWFSSWLREQCIEAGGCCGRGCKCCWSHQDLDFETWGGHCTPACPCCLQRDGIDRLIEQLGSHPSEQQEQEQERERRFDPGRGRKDRFTRKTTRAYAFHHHNVHGRVHIYLARQWYYRKRR
ncbi:hypothetical protein BDV06DRAFT_217037 [Aspergillus oleicola]